jgi:hypothetical protein
MLFSLSGPHGRVVSPCVCTCMTIGFLHNVRPVSNLTFFLSLRSLQSPSRSVTLRFSIRRISRSRRSFPCCSLISSSVVLHPVMSFRISPSVILRVVMSPRFPNCATRVHLTHILLFILIVVFDPYFRCSLCYLRPLPRCFPVSTLLPQLC